MFRSRTALSALLCLTALATPAVAATITGTVVDAATQSPLQGMVVAAWDPSGGESDPPAPLFEVTTDRRGLYELRNVPARSYRLLAYDPSGSYATAFGGGADSFDTTPIITLGAATHRADFALQRAGRAAGLVSDPRDRPIAGLVVAAYNDATGTRRGFTKSGSTGAWSLLLPPGRYRIAVYDETGAWATMFHRNVRTFTEATPVNIAAQATTGAIDLRVDRVARLSGHVRNVDGLALPGAEVFAYTTEGVRVTSVRADAAGFYRLTVPDGTYRLVAADPEGVWATSFYPGGRSFEKAPIVAVAADETRAGVDFGLERAASISGSVVSPGGALAGIVVGAFNADGSLHVTTRTGTGGAYALSVAPGEMRIAAWDPSFGWVTRFHPSARDFESAAPLVAGPGMSLTAIDVELVQGGRVEGRVRDAITKAAVAGVSVAAYDVTGAIAGEGRSDVDGRYGFAAVPGEVRLVAFDRLMRYAPAYPMQAGTFDGSSPVSVIAGKGITVDFELRRGTIVSGSVLDPWGLPLGGIEVFALDAAGQRVAAATTLEGAFAMVLVPGRYHFVAIDPLRRFAPRYFPAASTFEASSAVDVANGPNASVSISFQATSGRRRAARH